MANMNLWSRWLHLILLVVLTLLNKSNQISDQEQHVKQFFNKAESASGHTNNWAVLVCASRYWFNYRVSCWCQAMLLSLLCYMALTGVEIFHRDQHMANALGM